MILLDDRLCLSALGGGLRHLGVEGPLATTWSFHYRLVRALSDDERMGRLTRASTEALRRAAITPSQQRLRVLDPRDVTAKAAQLAREHGLNVLAAELLAAAVTHGAPVMLSHGNVGRTWPDVFAAEAVELRVVDG